MSMYVPYTYHLYHKPTGKRYYGVRYGKNCNPSDLWVTYFTSSKLVKKLVEEYGLDSFIPEVRRTFKSKDHALTWEHTVLRRLDVNRNPIWLNITYNRCPTNAGLNHSQETIEKIRQAHTGRKRSVSHSENISKSKLGQKMSQETREAMRRGQTGRKQSAETVAKRVDKIKGRRQSPETIEKIRQAAFRRRYCKLNEASTEDVS